MKGKEKQTQKQQTKEPSEISQILQMLETARNNKRILILALIVVLCIALVGYASQSVNSFSDYNPPDELYIYWADYLKDGNTSNGYSANNASTAYPLWSAEYPYRAVFMGARPKSSVTQNYESFFYVVYSKKPTTDIFTYEYTADRGSNRGRIRATAPLDKVNIGQDVIIVGPAAGLSTALSATGIANTLVVNYPSGWSNPFDSLHVTSGKLHFDFDFFFDCASEHNQNSSDLKMSGITSISNVPYKYIIHCAQHTGWAGNGSSGDGNTSGTGTSGQKWGSGKYGGGIDWGTSGKPTINGVGGYNSNRSDWNYNKPSFDNGNDIKFNPSSNWKDTINSGRESNKSGIPENFV